MNAAEERSSTCPPTDNSHTLSSKVVSSQSEIPNTLTTTYRIIAGEQETCCYSIPTQNLFDPLLNTEQEKAATAEMNQTETATLRLTQLNDVTDKKTPKTLVDIFYKNIKKKKEEFTGVLFVDFAKAFDVIDHDLLLRKLTLYGLSNDTLHLISSFLSNREQLVCINTIKSDFLPVKYGIPQGSVLGPLLFSLYINDLPLFIKALCELFADDTTIHSSHSNLNNLLLSLQESINNLLQWTELNHMSLNSYKTKYMTITIRQKRQNISSRMPLYIGNEKIVEVATHKVLGVSIDNNLSWTNHVNELTKRVSQKLYQLAKI